VIETEDLRDFVRREFLYDKDAPLGDQDRLFPDMIDSLGVMTLVDFVENAYDVSLDDSDLLAENFQSLEAIVSLVERRRAPA
jgi:acyl carrier protein